MGYNIEIYRAAQKTMDMRKLRAEEELDIRREDIYRRRPRVKEIEQRLVHIAAAAAKSVITGANKKEVLEDLKIKSLALQDELSSILKSSGLPENYLEPWYSCSECNDTGFIDGKMCRCMKQLVRQTAYEELNNISPLSLCSFETFSPEYYSKNRRIDDSEVTEYAYMSKVLERMKRYADNFDTYSEGMIFAGKTGLGKTHLSLAIAGKLIEKGFGVIYVSAPDILSRLETNQFSGRSDERQADQQLLQDCDLLIIDDLGTEFVTKFTCAAIYNIINTRLNSGKPMIISTNLSTDELERTYGSRMVSRMVGMLKDIEFFGSDIRQMKRTNTRY